VRESDLLNKKSPRKFRRLMKVGGFLFSCCVIQNINQKNEKPKVKILIALALFAASIVGALAQTHVNGYYRTDGTYVQPHYRSSPNNTVYDNWSTRGNVNPYTGQVGTRNDNDIRHYRGYRGYGYSGR
jgi:hypothetical protein